MRDKENLTPCVQREKNFKDPLLTLKTFFTHRIFIICIQAAKQKMTSRKKSSQLDLKSRIPKNVQVLKRNGIKRKPITKTSISYQENEKRENILIKSVEERYQELLALRQSSSNPILKTRNGKKP
ncbi:CLUMA_CG005817, isoform A [Clunio marinus]|uniref:CLUMA_CG005817, isoform A n=1 Tax=Clunio marinus TaxID=568069 RepID=A0A1J1HWB2_9DIPT|nr:CLUMA_CG005817, isoform A [Clunio marinus]